MIVTHYCDYGPLSLVSVHARDLRPGDLIVFPGEGDDAPPVYRLVQRAYLVACGDMMTDLDSLPRAFPGDELLHVLRVY